MLVPVFLLVFMCFHRPSPLPLFFASQAVQAAAAQAKQLAARKKSELGIGVAVTAVDGRLPPAQSLVSGVLVAEPEADQLERTCFLQGFPDEVSGTSNGTKL